MQSEGAKHVENRLNYKNEINGVYSPKNLTQNNFQTFSEALPPYLHTLYIFYG